MKQFVLFKLEALFEVRRLWNCVLMVPLQAVPFKPTDKNKWFGV